MNSAATARSRSLRWSRVRAALTSFIEGKRKTGVFLSVLGFGMGNYNDALMQTLAGHHPGASRDVQFRPEERRYGIGDGHTRPRRVKGRAVIVP